MKKLDVLEIFYKLRKNNFVIIKMSDIFPKYRFGSDIDIFAYNSEEFLSELTLVLKKYVSEKRVIILHRYEANIHVDILFEGKIELRFDIYCKIPEYNKVKIKRHLFLSIIENARPLKFSFKGKSFSVFVPSRIDDFLLRYIEYLEYYEVRNDKIKHLDYILDNIQDEERISVLDKLHMYTELNSNRKEKTKRKKVKRLFKRTKSIFRSYLVKIIKIIRKREK